MTVPGGTDTPAPQDRRSFVVLCAIHVGFAMPIAMLGVAWPSIRDDLGRLNGDLGLLAVCYGLGRLSLSGSAGLILRRVRFGTGLAAAVGALGLASAAIATAPTWPTLVAAVAFTGLASGAVDSLTGRYIAVTRSVGRAGLLAGTYGVGATIGPLVVALGDDWRLAYSLSAALGLVGAVAIGAPRHVWPSELTLVEPLPSGATPRAPHPPLRLSSGPVLASMAMMSAFVGVEVTLGQWLVTYLEDARTVDDRIAGLTVSAMWAGITIGRLALARVGVGSRHLAGLAIAVAALVGALTVAPGVALVAVGLLVGLALASFFPVVMATTAERVGSAAAPRMSGWQLIAGNVGATSVPALTGLVVAAVGEGVIPVVAWGACGLGLAAVIVGTRHRDETSVG